MAVVFVLTALMAIMASKVKMSYEMAQMLPQTDSTFIEFKNFKSIFGEDGSVMFMGIKSPKLDSLEYFNQWYDLTSQIGSVKGVKGTLSIAKAFQLVKDEETMRFKIVPFFTHRPNTQAELDSLMAIIKGSKFYDGTLFNQQNATILAVTLDTAYLGSGSRFKLVNDIKAKTAIFEKNTGIQVRYSGLPFIRIYMSEIVKSELIMFSVLTMLIASILLFLFFKSWKAVIFPMLIVLISLIWTLGYLTLIGYKITILTGILPPLVIIIVVENCIFLLNKYHLEYKTHQNKVKALARTIRRVGAAMFLTNLSTAVGFAAFTITGNNLLVEFGIIASISIMTVFVLSLVLIPVIYSLISPPNKKQIKHLDNHVTEKLIGFIERIIGHRRSRIYWITSIIVAIGFVGITFLKTSGNVVDDIPQKDQIYKDLCFFEEEFKGVLPFEILIDTKKKKGVMQMSTIKRIDKLQTALMDYPEFSKSISVAEVLKIAKMAYYNGDTAMYSLPKGNESAFIMSYLPKSMGAKKTVLNTFVDSTMQYTRVSVQIANIGTHRIDSIKQDLRTKIDSIFNPEKYKVIMTGTSIVFLEGTNYLVRNLAESLILAIFIITLIMAYLFRSFKILSIALITNLIPQVLTAAFMGYFDIPIKPSTIIIFSIALGISADNTILFLSRFRMELKINNDNIKLSVYKALTETAHSMLYSSTILFLGFSVFMLSSFGGTESLGKLISFTLFTALLANLILLPAMLLTLDKRMIYKLEVEPSLEVFEEEGDFEAKMLFDDDADLQEEGDDKKSN